MKRVISLILVLVMLLAAFPVTASAVTYSGYCGGEGDGTNLTWSLDTSNGVLSITGTGVMMDYSSSAVPWYSYRSSIKTVTIGEGVTSIGSCAFSLCKALTSITIPSSVTTIGEDALMWCDSLMSITIPESVTTIGSGAFSGCNSLTSITIPESVTTIGENAFFSCELTNLYIEDLVAWCGISFEDADANPMHDADNFYVSGELVTDLVIPSTVTAISDYAFYNCDDLISVMISEGVSTIGICAFTSCTELTTVTFSDSVKTIGRAAFSSCIKLDAMTLGNGVETIGDGAFQSCIKLTTVALGDNVKTIGDGAFKYCSGLNDFTVGENNLAFCSEDGVLFTKDKKTLVCYPRKKGITQYTIPDGVAAIGSYAFASYGTLTKVTIPDSVKIIGTAAFQSCDALTTVTIPDSVTTIGDNAFYDCNALSAVTLGSGVITIGRYAFASCNSLTEVEFPGSVKTIDDNAFWYNSLAGEVTIPDSVEIIGEAAFYRGNSITSVTIGKAVTKIGRHAFGGCESITNITVAAENTAYCSENGILFTKDKSVLVRYPAKKTQWFYKVPNTVVTVDEGAFSECAFLISVTFGNSTKTICDTAFSSCASLKTLKIPRSLSSVEWLSFDGCPLSDVYYEGTEYEWWDVVNGYCEGLEGATIHYECDLGDTSDMELTCSDLFYGYPDYLANNLYLLTCESKASDLGAYTFQKYIKTNHFKQSAISESIDVATDPSALSKFVWDNCGVAGFQLNEELDAANLKFVAAVCDVNLSAAKDIGTDNKYVKNLNSFFSVVKKVDGIVIEDEAYYEGLSKTELYDTFLEQTMAYLGDYCTQLSPQLPSIKAQLYTTLSETTDVLEGVTEMLDFCKALSLSIIMQETQMELVQEIIDTQDKNSNLYKGMTRLKAQLSANFVSYLTSTYIVDKGYEVVAESVAKMLKKGIYGSFATYESLVTGTVRFLNTAIFKWWLKADYSQYTTAVMLDDYARDLYKSILNKAGVFKSQFGVEEIEKFEALYHAYISVNNAVLSEYEALAKHISGYETEIADEVALFFEPQEAYKRYIDGVKETVSTLKPSSTQNFETWEVKADTVLSCGSNSIEEGHIYAVDGKFNADIAVATDAALMIETDVQIPSVAVYGEMYATDADVDVNVGTLKYGVGSRSYSETMKHYWETGNLYVDSTLSVEGEQFNSHRFKLWLQGGTLQINGDFNIGAYADVYVENGSKLYVTGDINEHAGYHGAITYGSTSLNVSDAEVVCCGDFVMEQGEASIGNSPQATLHLTHKNAIVAIDGNLITNSNNHDDENLHMSCGTLSVAGNVKFSTLNGTDISGGVIILDGAEPQTIQYLPVHDIEVRNPNGIVLGSNMELRKKLNTNGYPIQQNGYYVQLYKESELLGDTVLDRVLVGDVTYCSLNSDLICNYLLLSSGYLTIPEGRTLIVNGNVDVHYEDYLTNYGQLTIKGDLALNYTDVQGDWRLYNTDFNNYGKATVMGDIFGFAGARVVSAVGTDLCVGGNISLESSSYCQDKGTLILNGTDTQYITNYWAPTTIIDNESVGGVIFCSAISPSRLFDHRGNRFELSNDGVGSVFVDYDGDGILDNVDPYPTVAENGPVIERINVAGSNMTLGNELVVNILVKQADIATEGLTAYLTHHEETGDTVYTFEQEGWETYANAYYKFSVPVAAAQLTDQISIEIKDAEGNVYNEAYSTSACDYVGRVYASNADKVKTLMVDMLNYGAAAQEHFDYRTETLANAGLTEEQQVMATPAPECTDIRVKGVGYVGSNLSLQDRILLNVLFTGVDDATLATMYATVEFTGVLGNEVCETVPAQKLMNKYVGVAVDQIVLADAVCPVAVTVYNADGTVYGSATDSVESYIARMSNTGVLYTNIMKFAASALAYKQK